MSTNPTLDSKPVRALAGAADAAAETIRQLSTRVVDAVSDEKFREDVRVRVTELSHRVSGVVTDDKVREEFKARVSALPGEAQSMRAELPAFLKDLPEKVAVLPARARETFTWERRHELMTEIPARVRDTASQAAHQASKTYDSLAGRGEGVVARLREEYAGPLGERVAALRGRVAEAADEVAETTDKIADDLESRRRNGEPPQGE